MLASKYVPVAGVFWTNRFAQCRDLRDVITQTYSDVFSIFPARVRPGHFRCDISALDWALHTQ